MSRELVFKKYLNQDDVSLVMRFEAMFDRWENSLNGQSQPKDIVYAYTDYMLGYPGSKSMEKHGARLLPLMVEAHLGFKDAMELASSNQQVDQSVSAQFFIARQKKDSVAIMLCALAGGDTVALRKELVE